MVGQEKSMTVRFPSEMKELLRNMSQKTGISQSKLVLLATHSLLVHYEEKGNRIFKKLIQYDDALEVDGHAVDNTNQRWEEDE